MEFRLYITLGNDAMQTPADVADALEDAAQHLRNEGSFGGTSSPYHTASIHDANGNRVGGYRCWDAEL